MLIYTFPSAAVRRRKGEGEIAGRGTRVFPPLVNQSSFFPNIGRPTMTPCSGTGGGDEARKFESHQQRHQRCLDDETANETNTVRNLGSKLTEFTQDPNRFLCGGRGGEEKRSRSGCSLKSSPLEFADNNGERIGEERRMRDRARPAVIIIVISNRRCRFVR